MRRDRVIVQAPTNASDEEAITSEVFADVAEVEGVILPFGNDRALREYGYSENVQYRFFYKGQHDALKVGNQILYNSLKLPIVYVADYGKAMDVLLNTRKSSSFRTV